MALQAQSDLNFKRIPLVLIHLSCLNSGMQIPLDNESNIAEAQSLVDVTPNADNGPIQIAYLGPEGTYGQQAAKAFSERFEADIEFVPCPNIACERRATFSSENPNKC